MSYFQLAGVAFLVAYALIGYLFYLHFRPPHKNEKRSNYQKELDKYFMNMRQFAFSDEDIIQQLFHINTYQELKEINKKASKQLSK